MLVFILLLDLNNDFFNTWETYLNFFGLAMRARPDHIRNHMRLFRVHISVMAMMQVRILLFVIYPKRNVLQSPELNQQLGIIMPIFDPDISRDMMEFLASAGNGNRRP